MPLFTPRIFTAILAGLLFPVAAAAAEGDPVFSPLGWVFRFINFAILAWGFFAVVRKWLLPALRRRREGIAAAIAEATRTREKAEQRLREAEAKLAGLDAEMREFQAQAEREGAAEAERIRAAARAEAEKIERAAQGEIAAAERAARVELKALAARLAVEHAEALIRQRMSGEVEAGLFRTFLGNLAGSAN